jgi:2-polyprenyl-3-methyl-5-hydroxy-6-metoxy-1,4-benzoquinol methylase
VSKASHDRFAATHREPNPDKSWFQHGLALLGELGLPPSFRLLDVGAGNGEFCQQAAQRFDAKISCVDYAEPHLARLRSLGFDAQRCDFDSEADVASLVERYQGTFDVVVSFEVIEHVFDADLVLATIHRLLKPGGYLILSTPNVAYLGYRVYAAFRGNLPPSEGHHVRFYNQRRLQQNLEVSGFDVLEDASFGQSMGYVERTIGVDAGRATSLAFRAALHGALAAARTLKAPSAVSNLLFLAQKTERGSLGLDPAFRDAAFAALDETRRQSTLAHLVRRKREGLFTEHPGMSRFIDTQAAALR